MIVSARVFRTPFACCSLWAISFASAGAMAADYRLNPDTAVFAMITKKEGVASGLAHDHLILAKEFTATLKVPDGDLDKGSFEFKTSAADLVVDAPEAQIRHFPALKSLGIQSTPFSELSEKDRTKIKENALAKDQLDAAAFPEITAEVTKLLAKPLAFGGKTFSHSADVKIKVKGKTVQKTLPAQVQKERKTLKVETVGPFQFTDFGIQPYSALLGTIRNGNTFHLYVSFEAQEVAP
jgi:polyisoprenoid-binding protein YceI